MEYVLLVSVKGRVGKVQGHENLFEVQDVLEGQEVDKAGRRGDVFVVRRGFD